MAELPPVPNVLKVDIQWVLPNKLSGTGLFWAFTGSLTSATTANAIAAAIRTACVTDFVPLFPIATALGQVKVVDLTNTSNPVGLQTGSTSGARPGPALSVNDAAVVDFTVNRRYRGGKPKAFFPFGNGTDQQGGNEWTAAFVASVNSAYTSFNTALNAISTGGVVLTGQRSVSYYKGFTTYNGSGGRPKVRATQRPTPVVDIVSNHATNLIVGSQRRRLRI